jgi:hypothetical protein
MIRSLSEEGKFRLCIIDEEVPRLKEVQILLQSFNRQNLFCQPEIHSKEIVV